MDRKPGTQLVLLLIVVVATWGCRPQPDLGTAEQIFEPEWSRLNKSLIEYSLALIPRQPTEHPAEKWVSYLYAADALVENGEMERGRRIAEGLWPDLKPSDLPNSGAPIALAALLMERMGDHELGLDWAHHIQQPGNLARYLSQTKNPLDKTDLYDKLEASLNPEKGPELPLRILVVEAALQGGRTETVRRVADDGERLYRDKTPPAYPFHDLMNLARMEAKAERHDRAREVLSEALQAVDRVHRIRQEQLCEAAQLAVDLEQPELARRFLAEVETSIVESKHPKIYGIAAAYGRLGDMETALKWVRRGDNSIITLTLILENIKNPTQLEEVHRLFQEMGPGRLSGVTVWQQAMEVAGELEQPEKTQELLKIWLRHHRDNKVEPDAHNLAVLAKPIATYQIELDEETQSLLRELIQLNSELKKKLGLQN